VPDTASAFECPVTLTNVRAVVFDVDGTLYRQSPLRRAMVLQLARAHALHPIRGRRTMRILSAYRRAQEDLRHSPLDGSAADAQVALTAQRTGLPREEVAACVAHWMDVAPLTVLPRVGQPSLRLALESLRARELRLGVLSDYPADSKLAALEVLELFDCVVCAQDADVGAFKPDPRGLLVALTRLGVEPDEAVYVGDRIDVDASTAAAAGVRCVIVGGGTSTRPGGAAHWSITSLQELPDRLESR
jgi:HAD superfamily hydrolase (TIGR01549 family)